MQVRAILIGAALSFALVTAAEAKAKPKVPAHYKKAVAASEKRAQKVARAQKAKNPKVGLVNNGKKVRPAVRKPVVKKK
jgi:hypothetical protein